MAPGDRLHFNPIDTSLGGYHSPSWRSACSACWCHRRVQHRSIRSTFMAVPRLPVLWAKRDVRRGDVRADGDSGLIAFLASQSILAQHPCRPRTERPRGARGLARPVPTLLGMFAVSLGRSSETPPGGSPCSPACCWWPPAWRRSCSPAPSRVQPYLPQSPATGSCAHPDAFLSPWGGFALFCGYTVVALVAAAVLISRRDAYPRSVSGNRPAPRGAGRSLVRAAVGAAVRGALRRVTARSTPSGGGRGGRPGRGASSWPTSAWRWCWTWRRCTRSGASTTGTGPRSGRSTRHCVVGLPVAFAPPAPGGRVRRPRRAGQRAMVRTGWCLCPRTPPCCWPSTPWPAHETRAPGRRGRHGARDRRRPGSRSAVPIRPHPGDGVIALSALVTAATARQNVRRRRGLLASLEDRAAGWSSSGISRAAPRTAERTRIAREMHDIVSHNLRVMITLAAGAVFSPSRPGGGAGRWTSLRVPAAGARGDAAPARRAARGRPLLPRARAATRCAAARPARRAGPCHGVAGEPWGLPATGPFPRAPARGVPGRPGGPHEHPQACRGVGHRHVRLRGRGGDQRRRGRGARTAALAPLARRVGVRGGASVPPRRRRRRGRPGAAAGGACTRGAAGRSRRRTRADDDPDEHPARRRPGAAADGLSDGPRRAGRPQRRRRGRRTGAEAVA